MVSAAVAIAGGAAVAPGAAVAFDCASPSADVTLVTPAGSHRLVWGSSLTFCTDPQTGGSYIVHGDPPPAPLPVIGVRRGSAVRLRFAPEFTATITVSPPGNVIDSHVIAAGQGPVVSWTVDRSTVGAMSVNLMRDSSTPGLASVRLNLSAQLALIEDRAAIDRAVARVARPLRAAALVPAAAARHGLRLVRAHPKRCRAGGGLTSSFRGRGGLLFEATQAPPGCLAPAGGIRRADVAIGGARGSLRSGVFRTDMGVGQGWLLQWRRAHGWVRLIVVPGREPGDSLLTARGAIVDLARSVRPVSRI